MPRGNRNVEVETEIEFTWPLSITVIGTQGRPAPACSNPDSPRYSDCGDPTEVSDFRVSLEPSQAAAIGKVWTKWATLLLKKNKAAFGLAHNQAEEFVTQILQAMGFPFDNASSEMEEAIEGVEPEEPDEPDLDGGYDRYMEEVD
jgi:hypothetical protein